MGRAAGWRRCVLVVALLVVVAPNAAFADAGELRDRLAETRSERERAEQRLEDVRDAESEARARLSAIDAELDAAEQRLAAHELDLAAAQAASERAVEDANAARRRLAAVRGELGEVGAELDEKQGRLEERLRAAFKYGQVSLVEAFAGSRDMADVLNSTTYVRHVLDGDQALVDEVAKLVPAVERQRADAQAVRVEVEHRAVVSRAATAAVAEATAEQRRLAELVRTRQDEQHDALEALREDKVSIEGHLAGLEAESARIEAELAEVARRQAVAAGGPRVADPAGFAASYGRSAGGWVRPVAGSPSSPFGPRWGRSHNGVDLADPVGTPVVAADAGVVVHATVACHPTSSWGCGGGFGNYVTVAHPGGLATVYAHLSSIAVEVGQSVAAGEPVGRIGNSGNSYGPHLHFEVRRSGSPTDPCGYIDC